MSASISFGRRGVLRTASAALVGVAGFAPWLPCGASEETAQAEEGALIRRLIGHQAVLSPRVHLDMPAVFGNGYSVPMTLSVESEMTDSDHVRVIHVLAPQNPIIAVAEFSFTPLCGRAEISTRIRLAKPQTVLAVAEMNDGTLLLARRFVTVKTDGCS